MSKLETAIKIIAKYYNQADCGLFCTRNTLGDEMEQLYADPEITIDICRDNYYFEVFGLTPEEFKELKEFYNDLE